MAQHQTEALEGIESRQRAPDPRERRGEVLQLVPLGGPVTPADAQRREPGREDEEGNDQREEVPEPPPLPDQLVQPDHRRDEDEEKLPEIHPEAQQHV